MISNKSIYFFDEHNTDYESDRIIKDECTKSILNFIHFGQFEYHRTHYKWLNVNGEWIEKSDKISPKAKYKMKR